MCVCEGVYVCVFCVCVCVCIACVCVCVCVCLSELSCMCVTMCVETCSLPQTYLFFGRPYRHPKSDMKIVTWGV